MTSSPHLGDILSCGSVRFIVVQSFTRSSCTSNRDTGQITPGYYSCNGPLEILGEISDSVRHKGGCHDTFALGVSRTFHFPNIHHRSASTSAYLFLSEFNIPRHRAELNTYWWNKCQATTTHNFFHLHIRHPKKAKQ